MKKSIQLYFHSFVRRIIIFAELLIEIIFILIKMIKIRKEINKNCFLHPRSSFGHQCNEFDWISRLLHPNKVSVFLINPINKQLQYCFDTIKTYDFSLFKSNDRYSNRFKNKYLMLVIRLILAIFNKNIIDRNFLIQLLNEKGFDAKIEINNKLINRTNHSGIYRIIKQQIGSKPKLHESKIELIKSSDADLFNKLNSNPIIAFILRSKFTSAPFSSSRSAGNAKNYLDTLKYLSLKNYNIIGLAETNHDIFREINNYYASSDFLQKELVELFALTNCKLYLGQASGTSIMPVNSNVPVLMADCGYYFGSISNEKTMLLCKRIYNNREKNFEDPIKLLQNNSPIIYKDLFQNNEYKLIENTSKEILETTKILIELIEGNPEKYIKSFNLTKELKKILPNTLDLKFILGSFPFFYFK